VDPDAKVIAKLPSTVTTPVFVGDRVPFAVSGGDLRYFDPQNGQRTAAGDAAVTP
jgi:multiple sugar transport system ATP-binding protein